MNVTDRLNEKLQKGGVITPSGSGNVTEKLDAKLKSGGVNVVKPISQPSTTPSAALETPQISPQKSWWDSAGSWLSENVKNAWASATDLIKKQEEQNKAELKIMQEREKRGIKNPSMSTPSSLNFAPETQEMLKLPLQNQLSYIIDNNNKKYLEEIKDLRLQTMARGNYISVPKETATPTQTRRMEAAKKISEDIREIDKALQNNDYFKTAFNYRLAEVGGNLKIAAAGFAKDTANSILGVYDQFALTEEQKKDMNTNASKVNNTFIQFLEDVIREETYNKPDFGDALQQGVGSMGTMIGASLLTGGSVWVPTIIESLQNAGSVYDENINQGKSGAEAFTRSSAVFVGNIVWNKVLNKFSGVFDAIPVNDISKVKEKFLEVVLKAGSGEFVQEGGQTVGSNIATDRPWDEGLLESAAVGFIIGGGAKSIQLIATKNKEPFFETKDLQTVQQILQTYNEDSINILNQYSKTKLTPNSSVAEIRKAFKEAAFLTNVDFGAGDNSLYLRVIQAYDNLMKIRNSGVTIDKSGVIEVKLVKPLQIEAPKTEATPTTETPITETPITETPITEVTPSTETPAEKTTTTTKKSDLDIGKKIWTTSSTLGLSKEDYVQKGLDYYKTTPDYQEDIKNNNVDWSLNVTANMLRKSWTEYDKNENQKKKKEPEQKPLKTKRTIKAKAETKFDRNEYLKNDVKEKYTEDQNIYSLYKEADVFIKDLTASAVKLNKNFIEENPELNNKNILKKIDILLKHFDKVGIDESNDREFYSLERIKELITNKQSKSVAKIEVAKEKENEKTTVEPQPEPTPKPSETSLISKDEMKKEFNKSGITISDFKRNIKEIVLVKLIDKLQNELLKFGFDLKKDFVKDLAQKTIFNLNESNYLLNIPILNQRKIKEYVKALSNVLGISEQELNNALNSNEPINLEKLYLEKNNLSDNEIYNIFHGFSNERVVTKFVKGSKSVVEPEPKINLKPKRQSLKDKLLGFIEFNSQEGMDNWIAQNKDKYSYEEVFINNGFGLNYRPLNINFYGEKEKKASPKIKEEKPKKKLGDKKVKIPKTLKKTIKQEKKVETKTEIPEDIANLFIDEVKNIAGETNIYEAFLQIKTFIAPMFDLSKNQGENLFFDFMSNEIQSQRMGMEEHLAGRGITEGEARSALKKVEKAIRIMRITKNEDYDLDSISEKVEGFDEVLEALRNVGIEFKDIKDMQNFYKNLVEQKKEAGKPKTLTKIRKDYELQFKNDLKLYQSGNLEISKSETQTEEDFDFSKYGYTEKMFKKKISGKKKLTQEQRTPRPNDFFEDDIDIDDTDTEVDPQKELYESYQKTEEDLRKTLGDSANKFNIIQLPELVELVKTLTNLSVEVLTKINRSNPLGLHKGGKLSLRADIFKYPFLAQKVLSHEIGHLIDWLPNFTMKRGNILGRLFTLREFTKGSFTNEKVQEQIDQLVAQLKPLQATRKENKNNPKMDLLLKARLDKKYLEQIKEINTKIRELQENAFINNEIFNELYGWSLYWRNLKREDLIKNKKFDTYIRSSVELYADALSGIITSPLLFEQKAPKFYKAFFANLDRKPEVKAIYLELQDRIRAGSQEVSQERNKIVNESFDAAQDIAVAKDKESEDEKFDLWFHFRNLFIIRFTAITDLEKKTNTPYEDQSSIKFGDILYADAFIKNLIEDSFAVPYKMLDNLQNGWNDLGQILLNERVIYERGELANPFGKTPETARQDLEVLLNSKSQEDKETLLEALRLFRSGQETLLEYFKENGIYSDQLMRDMEANTSYATFQVVDYIDKYITSEIYSQVGTLKDIANPATATMLKNIAIVRMIQRNNAIKTLGENLIKLGGVKEADTYFDKETGFLRIKESQDPKLGLIKWKEKGKWKGLYVDKYIAESANYQTSENLKITNKFLEKVLIAPIYRNLFIIYNAAFQSANVIRDFKRTWKSLPTKSFYEAMAQFFQTAKAYKGSVKASWARATGEFDSTIKEMENKKILGLTYNDIILGQEDSNIQIEREFTKLGISKKKGISGKITSKLDSYLEGKEKIRTILKYVENFLNAFIIFGDFAETLPKVAGYNLLSEKSNMSEPQLREFIRTRVGSPAYRYGGVAKPIINPVFLFSNAIIQSTVADIKTATEPSTRIGYLYKTVVADVVPQALKIAILQGIFGEALKELFEEIPEWDIMNYDIIPISLDENGKPIYARIPKDESGRLVSAIVWKLLKSPEYGISMQDITSIFAGFGEVLPNLNPTITILGDIYKYAIGQNPTDYRGRNMIPDKEWAARNKTPDALKIFLSETLKNMGIGVILPTDYKWQTESTITPLQKFLGLPFINKTVGNFIKVSDYGAIQRANALKQEIAGERAARILQDDKNVDKRLREFLAEPNKTSELAEQYANLAAFDSLKKQGDFTPDEEKRIKAIKDKFKIGAIKGFGDPKLNSFINADTNEEKAYLILRYTQELNETDLKQLQNELQTFKLINQTALDIARQIQTGTYTYPIVDY